MSGNVPPTMRSGFSTLVDPNDIEANKIVVGSRLFGAITMHVMQLAAKYANVCSRDSVTAEDVARAFKVASFTNIDDDMPRLLKEYDQFLIDEPEFASDSEEEEEGEACEDTLTCQLQAMDSLLEELDTQQEFTIAPVSAWDDEDIWRMTHAHKTFENTDFAEKGTISRCLQNSVRHEFPGIWTQDAVKDKLVQRMTDVAEQIHAEAAGAEEGQPDAEVEDVVKLE
jgi:hypothetical protein